MVCFVVFLFSLTITLCVSSEDKTHDIWLTRMEFGVPDPEWISNEAFQLNKVNRNRKSLDLNFTILQEINKDNLICEVKFFQKNGGKYVKAVFNIPKISCCVLMANNGVIWRCIQEKGNLPESCPMPVGDYQVKDFDPDLCDYPKVLPPNGVEDYKIEFFGFVGSKQIFKHVGYGTLKKRIQIV